MHVMIAWVDVSLLKMQILSTTCYSHKGSDSLHLGRTQKPDLNEHTGDSAQWPMVDS